MSQAIIRWSDQAVRQYHNLTSTQQQAALRIVQNLSENPFAGYYSHQTTVKDGTTAYIHTYPGALVVVEYFRRGVFRKRITVWIHSVRPMDWPSTDMDDEC